VGDLSDCGARSKWAGWQIVSFNIDWEA